MNFLKQKQRFYNIYNEYQDFYIELANNCSNALTILCAAHKLLDLVFNMEDDIDIDQEIKNYLTDTHNLDIIIDFLEQRTLLVKSLYDEYPLDEFEELAIVLYFKTSLEEIKNIYDDYKLKNHHNYQKMIDKINLLDEYLKTGTYLEYDEQNEMDLELNSYYEAVKDEPLMSMLIFELYSYLIDNNDEKIEEESLEKLSEHISFLVKNVSIEYGEKILELPKNNKIRKKFLELKNILDDCSLILDIYDGDIDELCEDLNLDFNLLVTFVGSLYMAIVHLFFKEYNYLDIKNLSQLKQDKLINIINFYGIQLFIEGISDHEIEVQNLDVLLEELQDDNIPIKEYNFEQQQLETIFLDKMNLDYASVEEYIKDISVKIKHFANRYY